MRSIEEIKAEIGAEYIRHPKVIERYGLEAGKSFDEQFSKLSIENLLFYAVATVIYSIEWIRETFLADVETAKKESMCGNAMWYRQQCLQFEYDNASPLVWDEEKVSWRYAEEKPENRILNACCVSETSEGIVVIKVNKKENNKTVPLTKTELLSFQNFVEKIKIAGTIIGVYSKKPDILYCEMKIYYDSLRKKSTELEEAINNASNTYLQNLPFGGIYSINKHIQAIMAVDGVESVKPMNVSIKSDTETVFMVCSGKIEKTHFSPSSGYLNTDINGSSEESSKITFTYEIA